MLLKDADVINSTDPDCSFDLDLPCLLRLICRNHYENTAMQHTAIFHGCKNDSFQLNVLDFFHIFAKT